VRFLFSEQVRAWDRCAMAERGIPGLTLMNRAGAAVARVAARLAAVRGEGRVLLVAGRGNNGGDAFAAARCLHEDGLRVAVQMTCAPETLRGDARAAWAQMQQAGVPFHVRAEETSWPAAGESDLPRCGVIVDGLLGTGSEGVPRGVVAAAIRWIEHARRGRVVVAIDLPSGLNADTGEPADPVVRADVTVCLAAPKSGFASPRALEFLGHVEVVDIGLPADLLPETARVQPLSPGAQLRFIGAPVLASLLSPRRRDAHKGSFGHVLVIGGSHGLGGAPALAAMGALRAGAGLVSAAVPQDSLVLLAALAPAVMAHRIAVRQGAMTPATLAAGIRAPSGFDVVLAGPGMSPCAATARIVEDLLRGPARGLVLDADALNVLAGRVEQLRRAAGDPPVIITPHPGEAARLLGLGVAAVQADRVQAARQLAVRSGAVVVLKGAATLVVSPEGAVHLNLTGNPGMATGGTGDVLAGVIAGLWAQGLAPLDAARLAVYLHGTAGDLVAWQAGEPSLAAEDLGRALGPALRWMESMS
jgi:NAD(P)H-hydrate epimerase